MRHLVSRSRALVAVAAVLGTLVVASPSAAEVAAAQPHLYGLAKVISRGSGQAVAAAGLEPGRTYTLTVDAGTLRISGAGRADVVANSYGNAQTMWDFPATVPADRSSVRVQLVDATSGVDVVLDSVDLAVAQPFVQGSVCPAHTATFNGYGLSEGTYDLSATGVTFEPAQVTTSDGAFTTVGTAALTATSPVTVTMRSTADPRVVYSMALPLAAARAVREFDPTAGFWHVTYTAYCFAPGERITAARGSAVAVGRPTVAGSDGSARIVIDLHPGATTHRAPPVRYTGASSGQTADVGGEVDVLETTLAGGHRLLPHGNYWGAGRIIVAPQRGYFLANGHCHPGISYMFPDGSEATYRWGIGRDHPNTECYFGLTRHGSLYLDTTGGKRLWSSHTTGTTSGNRLVMSSRGYARLYTATGAVIWSTDGGRVLAPAGSVLKSGSSLSRGQYRSRGNVRFGLDNRGNAVVIHDGRTVWTTHVSGRHGVRLALESSGNLVLRTAQGRAVWNSGTHAVGGRVVVGPDGYVRILDRHNVTRWHTHTGV